MITIKRFGTIHENEEGCLVIQGFNIDAGGSDIGLHCALLTAIIGRLQKELAYYEGGSSPIPSGAD